MSDHLKELFDSVADPSDWRNPIDAVINLADFADIAEAVDFYTSTDIESVELLPGNKCRVTAVGYRNGPAGP